MMICDLQTGLKVLCYPEVIVSRSYRMWALVNVQSP